jgi:hypothetical protein
MRISMDESNQSDGGFGMKTLIDFMQDSLGRVVRVVLGLVLIAAGLLVVGGTAGIVVAIIGLLPIVMGVWGPCALGFVFKQPTHA